MEVTPTSSTSEAGSGRFLSYCHFKVTTRLVSLWRAFLTVELLGSGNNKILNSG